MIPATPPPRKSKVKTPVIVKLKPSWRFDPGRRVFVTVSGEEFRPTQSLPKNTKVVLQTPSLSTKRLQRLSKAEKELTRYVHVIPPPGKSPGDYLETIRDWPCVEKAYVAPEVSLPGAL